MIQTHFCLAVAFASFCGIATASDLIPAEGLAVNEAVAPDLVTHPLAAAFDDRGRLFVAQLNQEKASHEDVDSQQPYSIRLLEDLDKDGVFDHATTFADGLTSPRGVLWIYDSLYVFSPPDLWRFADPDGDGIAEERERLFTGFGLSESTSHTRGPFLHPSGRLFWTHGDEPFEITDNDTGETLETGTGPGVWSSLLNGGEIEQYASGVETAPLSLGFTLSGDVIGTIHSLDSKTTSGALAHWTYGAVLSGENLSQPPAVSSADQTPLGGVEGFEVNEVSGLCQYQSAHLKPQWLNQWIVAQGKDKKLTMIELVPSGATFRAGRTEEILRSSRSESFFSDVVEDFNGDLLVLDLGLGSSEEKSGSAPPVFPGSIYRVSYPDRPYKAPAFPEWERLTSEAVSTFLDAEEFWLRDRAGLELAGRGDPAIPELKRILRSEDASPIAKVNSVWTLAKLRFSESTDLILEALEDPHAEVRQSASHAMSVTRAWQSIAANEPAEREIEWERNRTISAVLAKMVRSDDPMVAREAATALGRMAESRAIGAIVGRLGRTPEDSFLRHALINALVEIDDPESTAPALSSENAFVVSGVLTALDAMPSGELEVLNLLEFLDHESEVLRRTAARIAAEHPSWDAALANRFFEWNAETPEKVETMMTVVPSLLASPPMRDFVTALLTDEDPEKNTLALTFLQQGDQIEMETAWLEPLANYLRMNAKAKNQELTLKILTKIPTPDLEQELRQLWNNPDTPIATRIHALAGFSSGKENISEIDFTELRQLLMENSLPGLVEDEIFESLPLSEAQKETLFETRK